MKRKFVAPLIALLLCVSMIGVGFAGWVITTSMTDDARGSFSVYAVENKFVKFSVPETIDPIKFGGTPANYSAPATAWLSWDDTDENVGTTNLTASIPIQLQSTEPGNANLSSFEHYKGKTIKFVVTISIPAAQWNNYNSASDYIDGPAFAQVNSQGDYKASAEYSFTVTNEGTVTSITKTAGGDAAFGNATAANGIVTIPISWDWDDDTFGGEHPLNHYNEITNPSDAQVLEAQTALSTLNSSSLESVQYTVTVVGTIVT